jgi:chemotaxis protein CheD
MPDVASELPEVYLHPGEAYFARSPTILKTLLGSCVGITFWSSRFRIGALCHGVLPRSPAGVEAREGYRYVDFAICDLLRKFQECGIAGHELQVKLFGGADVLAVVASPSSRPSVGQQNLAVALDILKQEGLALLASDLGGLAGRTIQFHTGTGEVLLKRLARMEE